MIDYIKEAEESLRFASSGNADSVELSIAAALEGIGWALLTLARALQPSPNWRVCGNCGGTGQVEGEECPACYGKGTVYSIG